MSNGSTPAHHSDQSDEPIRTPGGDFGGGTPLHNPEPPAELLESLNADTIGHTVFSKHWLFTTLMRLIQDVDKHTEAKERCESGEGGCFNVNEGLQDELCKLWDMSMNPEVVSFLQEFKAVDILTGVIAKSQAPRATEIAVGILGNMACNSTICRGMSENDKLINLILMLLENPDPPTLVETTRLIHTCISMAATKSTWISAIKKDSTVLTNLMFILHSSTNKDLLQNAGEVLDKLLDTDEELCEAWSNEELVLAVLEACKQLGAGPSPLLDTYIHILQLVSTSETGVEALVTYGESCSDLLLSALLRVCSDEIIVVADRENSLSSCISVLNVIFTSWQKAADMVLKSTELVRCIVKILSVVYAMINKMNPKSDASDTDEPEAKANPKNELTETSNRNHDSNSNQESSEVTGKSNSQHPKHDSEDKVTDDNAKVKRSRRKSSSVSAELTTLYDILQGFMVDILMSLSDSQGSAGPVPAGLQYLDESCSRHRIRHVVLALSDWLEGEEMVPIQCLDKLVARYNLSRLREIITDARNMDKI